MANALYDKIKSLVVIKDNPAFAGCDPIKKVLVVANQLTDALLHVYDSLRGEPVDQAELAEALQLFFTEYVVPIDLPLNDFLETYVESSLASLFAPLVKTIDAKLDQKLPHGPDAA